MYTVIFISICEQSVSKMELTDQYQDEKLAIQSLFKTLKKYGYFTEKSFRRESYDEFREFQDNPPLPMDPVNNVNSMSELHELCKSLYPSSYQSRWNGFDWTIIKDNSDIKDEITRLIKKLNDRGVAHPREILREMIDEW